MYPYTTYHAQRLSDVKAEDILAAQTNEPEQAENGINGGRENPPENMPANNGYDEYDVIIKNMMNDAIRNKSEQASYYARLARTIHDKNDSDIIHNIHLDELKHAKMLTDIYNDMFGSEPEISSQERGISQNMIYEFEKSMYDELEAAQYLRKLYFYFLNLGIRDYLYEIMSDDNAHALKLSHLYSKYNK